MAFSASCDSEMRCLAASAVNSRFSSADGRAVIDGEHDDGEMLAMTAPPICCKKRTLRYPAITRYSPHMTTLLGEVNRGASCDRRDGAVWPMTEGEARGIAEPLYDCVWSPQPGSSWWWMR